MSREPERVFFSGDSLEQAVMAAARHYDCDPDELLYERLEKRHGFLRTPRRVVIRVDPQNFRRATPHESRLPSPEDQLAAMDRKAQDRDVPAPTREPRHGGPPPGRRERRDRERKERHGRDIPIPTPGPSATSRHSLRETLPVAEGAAADAARDALDALIELTGLELDADVRQGEDRLEIDLAGADEEELQYGEGQVLRSFQHLLPRMLQVSEGSLTPCRVDSSGYQTVREEELRKLVRKLAEEVRADGHPKTLRPLSPADRRIVHLALADDPEIVTESQGNGYYKRVTLRVS